MTVETRTGARVSVRVRHSTRARRLSLRIDPAGDGAVLVIPEGVPQTTAERFARENAGWLARHLARQPERIAFEDGAIVPILGQDHEIRHVPERRGGVWMEDTQAAARPLICVAGSAEHVPRRVTDWLKRRARAEIAPRARAFADQLDRRVSRLSIRDTRSRWGSCSSQGGLSFSWRLILAPESVLDYVCAHEAAHLVELNHSAAFWRHVADLIGDWKTPRHWLRHHGARLHRYG